MKSDRSLKLETLDASQRKPLSRSFSRKSARLNGRLSNATIQLGREASSTGSFSAKTEETTSSISAKLRPYCHYQSKSHARPIGAETASRHTYIRSSELPRMFKSFCHEPTRTSWLSYLHWKSRKYRRKLSRSRGWYAKPVIGPKSLSYPTTARSILSVPVWVSRAPGFKPLYANSEGRKLISSPGPLILEFSLLKPSIQPQSRRSGSTRKRNLHWLSSPTSNCRSRSEKTGKTSDWLPN